VLRHPFIFYQLGVRVCQPEKGVNERVRDGGRQVAETDKYGDASRGAVRGDVIIADVNPDEKIAREQGFYCIFPLATMAAAVFALG